MNRQEKMEGKGEAKTLPAEIGVQKTFYDLTLIREVLGKELTASRTKGARSRN